MIFPQIVSQNNNKGLDLDKVCKNNNKLQTDHSSLNYSLPSLPICKFKYWQIFFIKIFFIFATNLQELEEVYEAATQAAQPGTATGQRANQGKDSPVRRSAAKLGGLSCGSTGLKLYLFACLGLIICHQGNLFDQIYHF